MSAMEERIVSSTDMGTCNVPQLSHWLDKMSGQILFFLGNFSNIFKHRVQGICGQVH